MHQRLFDYIWQYSARQQLVIVFWTCASFPLLYFSLEIPKIIINEALSGDRTRFNVLGCTFDQIEFLVTMCLTLLGLIVINGLLKMRINTLKGIVGERLIRRLRYELIQRIFRFPTAHLARSSQGEFISTITAETEPLAGYISESVALPLFQGGTMLTILVFMFVQDWVFGVASIALIPVQGYIIPKLQNQVNILKKERVLRVRKLSDRVGETISGAQEIKLQGTQRYALAEFSHWLGGLFYVRLQIFRKKFFMKFLNNTIGQVTPFMFYLFGGYLVIKGDLTIGALVAALAAYKDLTSPWKELLNHYQNHADAIIRYGQILEQFSPAGLVAKAGPAALESADNLRSTIRGSNVSWASESGEQTINGLDFAIEPGSRVAILAESAVLRMRLAQLLTGLEIPNSGSITVGDASLKDIDPEVLRTRLAYQGPDPHFFKGTIQQNIVYGLYHRPPTVAEASDPTKAESAAAGNSTDDYSGDWIDYGRIGIDSEEHFEEHYLEGALAVGSEQIMYQSGLAESLDPEDNPEFAERLLAARKAIREKVLSEGLQRVVCEFDPELFNPQATIAENILFGIPARPNLGVANLSTHPHLLWTLEEVGLLDVATSIGRKLLLRLARGIGDSKRENRLLGQFGIDSAEQAAELARIGADGDEAGIPDERRYRFIGMFLQMVPELHRFVDLDSDVIEQILQARHIFSLELPQELAGGILVFDPQTIHPKLSIHDNLLFGRMVTTDPVAEAQVTSIVDQTLEELSLKRAVMLQMTQSEVGVSGQRLPATARHGIAVSRMLIKRPEVMIFHDALAPFSETERASVRTNIRELLPESTMIWIDRSIADRTEFDLVLELDDSGAVREQIALEVEDAGATDNVLAIIGGSSICGRLDAARQQVVAENSAFVNVATGEFVYHAGDTARHAYIVLEGEARAYRDSSDPDTLASVVQPGGTFGMMELISERSCILSVQAESPLRLLRIDGDAISDIIEDDLAVVQTLLRALTEQWAGATRGSRVY